LIFPVQMCYRCLQSAILKNSQHMGLGVGEDKETEKNGKGRKWERRREGREEKSGEFWLSFSYKSITANSASAMF